MDENHLGQPLDDAGGVRDETINISDVIEVIETDPDFNESSKMHNGDNEPLHGQPPASRSRPNRARSSAFVRITEQPASRALRFRYECEGRSAGSIPSASSTAENKTFPSIQVVGYQGRAVVVVSCVTKDEPYRPHPHNLVGREGCRRGVCTMEIAPETMSMMFSNLGIQCVKRRDIERALTVREEIKVDPFLTGFGHKSQPTSIDLNAVRLCFQVFIEGDRPGKFTVALTPVVSEPIYDKKAMCDLVIIKLSHCVSYVDGGRNDIILLCEKVSKEDIQVRFYEEVGGRVVWEAFGEFTPSQVHKQVAISFKPPRYRTLDVVDAVKAFIQLRRPSDGVTSEALPFQFLPLDSDNPRDRKRVKKAHDSYQNFKATIDGTIDKSNKMLHQTYNPNIPMEAIKIEPKDHRAPSPYGGHLVVGCPSPAYSSLSPNYVMPGSVSPQLNNQYVQNPQVLPSIENVLQTNWNLPSTSYQSVQMQPNQSWNVPAAAAAANHEITSFIDLDSQQELQQIDLNSGDIENITRSDALMLSETFQQHLSLSDIRADSNISDSFNVDRMVNDVNF